jgi:hypothetical protein
MMPEIMLLAMFDTDRDIARCKQMVAVAPGARVVAASRSVAVTELPYTYKQVDFKVRLLVFGGSL